MTNDPCAPLRRRVQEIQEEIQQRQGQAGGETAQILTPDQVESDLASKTAQQLQRDLRAAQEKLAQCEAAEGAG